jgi:hypothetical protein
MRTKLARPRLFSLFGLIAFLGACGSGCVGDRHYGSAPDTTRIAQRPTYPIEGTRPLYLGGYAGANYDPATRPSR